MKTLCFFLDCAEREVLRLFISMLNTSRGERVNVTIVALPFLVDGNMNMDGFEIINPPYWNKLVAICAFLLG